MNYLRIILSLFISILNCSNKKEKLTALNTLFSLQNTSTEVFFGYPGRYEPIQKKREVLDRIIKLIKDSKQSISIYAYSFNHPEIIAELVKARSKGIKITFLLDAEIDYSLLKENSFTYRIYSSTGLYHIKAMLFDGRYLFTGTGNFSRHGLTRDWNGFILIDIEKKNQAKVKDFLEENYKEPILFTNHFLFINSPQDGLLIQNKIIEEINKAKKKINYLIFDHFDKIITEQLKQASHRGVVVKGIYDSPTDDEGMYLKDQFYNLESNIYRDANEDKILENNFFEGGLLHHKTIIIDDEVLISGSYNLSASARDKNRELFYITKDLAILNEFKKEFERVLLKSNLEQKTNLYFSKDTQTINQVAIQNQICLENLNFPSILEIDFGLFSTYQYYETKKNCLLLEDREEISTTVSDLSNSNLRSLNPFLHPIKLRERNSNKELTRDSNFQNQLFKKNLELLEINFLRFSNIGKIQLSFNPSKKFSDTQVYLWIPSLGFLESNLIKLGNDLYEIDSEIPSNRRNYILGRIENQFFCFKSSSTNQIQAVEFIPKKVYFDLLEKNLNTKFIDCFTPE